MDTPELYYSHPITAEECNRLLVDLADEQMRYASDARGTDVDITADPLLRGMTHHLALHGGMARPVIAEHVRRMAALRLNDLIANDYVAAADSPEYDWLIGEMAEELNELAGGQDGEAPTVWASAVDDLAELQAGAH